jgi:hypothetical protein
VFDQTTDVKAKVEEIMGRWTGWSGGLRMMADDDDADDADDGGDDDGGSLLDDEADDDNDGGDDDGGDGDDDAVNDLLDRLEKRLEKRFDSIADRRTNALLKEIRKQTNSGGKDDDADDGDDDDSPKGRSKTRTTGPSKADVREGRMVYREFVGEKIKFLGDVEREHATTLAGSLIAAKIQSGTDPEDAGREAADEVAKTLRSLRKHYEGKTLAALKRRGLLPEDGRGDGQPPSRSGPPGAGSSFKKGQDKAAEMFADRQPQQSA